MSRLTRIVGRSPTILALAGLCVAAGCRATPAELAAPTAETSDGLVAHTRLSGYLPAPEGWARGEISGGQVGSPDPPRSSSGTSYTRGAERIDLDIVDTSRQPEYVEATQEIAGTEFERVSANGYFRGTTIGGHPAVESWNHVDKLGELTVLLVDRFVVHASSSGLDDIDALRQFVLLVDLESVAKLEAR